MDKIKRVIIEYQDHILIVEGKEAEKWLNYSNSVSSVAAVHGCNPFDDDPIDWENLKYKSPTK